MIEFNEDASKPLVISDVKAVIADCIGDMLETYRYESTEEGQAIEGYIDQLLSIVRKHEKETQKRDFTKTSFSPKSNQKRKERKDGPKSLIRKLYSLRRLY